MTLVEQVSQRRLLHPFETAGKWMKRFDPQVPMEIKDEIGLVLRENMRSAIDDQESMLELRYRCKRERIRPGGIAAIVMVAGYAVAPAIYLTINSTMPITDFVFIGYSAGIHSNDKYFKDGTPMSGKMFISEDDLARISSSPQSQIILMDTTVETGLTIYTIKRSLRNIAIESELFHVTVFQNCALANTGDATRSVDSKLKIDVPVFTEKRKIFEPRQ